MSGGAQWKIKNQIMSYRWTFRKDLLELEKNLWGIPIKYDITDYGIKMELQKKSFNERVESCTHWLKIKLRKKLGRLVEKYRIAI